MADLLKNIYNKAFFDQFCDITGTVIKDFDRKVFLKKIYDKEWEQRELKQRMKHIASVLKDFLPANYDKCISAACKLITELKKKNIKQSSIELMFFPEIIEQYGIDHLEVSVKGMEFITQIISCEFAIRPFIIKYPKEMMKTMLVWSKHESHHVRRLASEGCRPRLPWAMAIPALKKNPSPIFPVLENLKNDPSEFVRRSVANNLNDIAKDHPEKVMEIALRWQGKCEDTDWIIKHGCRTLLKKANPDALSFFGLASAKTIAVRNFEIDNCDIALNDDLCFSFELIHKEKEPLKLRVEYCIYYMKANGKQNKKIFKITENVYASDVKHPFKRKQSFRDLTTRKHYAGEHKLSLVINGKEMITKDFYLSK
ncbi:MAG: DNA alkylation repair protein [Sporocytophaga sp.]|nr:DNA alkylation repair protein [Sporocytophaga sp.]